MSERTTQAVSENSLGVPLETVADVIRAIPLSWKKARIAISGIGNPQKIARISFHKSASGPIVILLHSEAMRPIL